MPEYTNAVNPFFQVGPYVASRSVGHSPIWPKTYLTPTLPYCAWIYPPHQSII